MAFRLLRNRLLVAATCELTLLSYFRCILSMSYLIDYRNTPFLKTVRTPKHTVHVRYIGLYRTPLNVDSTLADSSIFYDLGKTQYKTINRDMAWNSSGSTESYRMPTKKNLFLQVRDSDSTTGPLRNLTQGSRNPTMMMWHILTIDNEGCEKVCT